jgi:hypothetical protein
MSECQAIAADPKHLGARINGGHPIFIVSRADAAKNHASVRLARAGADAMKAVAIG